MLVWFAKTFDAANMCALIKDSSILINVWSPLAPIHVALLPYLAPVIIHYCHISKYITQKLT